ncbi:MAG: hypothetical protein R3B47_12350 [Bacteroidia bacterium]
MMALPEFPCFQGTKSFSFALDNGCMTPKLGKYRIRKPISGGYMILFVGFFSMIFFLQTACVPTPCAKRKVTAPE